MDRWLSNALGIVSICAVCLIGWTAWRIGVLADSVKVPDFTQTTAKMDQVLDTINRPCGDGHPCGTLANVDKTVVKVGDAIVTTQLTERYTAPHVTAAMDALNSTAGHLSATADALTETANALTGTAHGATDMLATGKESIAALQPLLRSLDGTAQASTVTVQTFNGRLSDPRIDSLLLHLDSTTGHIDGIAANGQKVTDKLTNDFIAPKPWYRKIGPSLSDIWDFSALAARHM